MSCHVAYHKPLSPLQPQCPLKVMFSKHCLAVFIILNFSFFTAHRGLGFYNIIGTVLQCDLKTTMRGGPGRDLNPRRAVSGGRDTDYTRPPHLLRSPSHFLQTTTPP